MLGRGLESPDRGSHTMLIALAAAVLVHVLVLTVKLTFKEPPSTRSLALNIQLREELIEKKEQIVEQEQPKQQPSPKEETVAPRPPIPNDIIVTEKSVEDSPTPKLQLQINSDEFQRFLHRETRTHSDAKPQTIDRFSLTFEESVEQKNILTNDSIKARAQIRSHGNFSTQDKDGKRTCYAQIFDLLDTIEGAPSYTTRDCTPEKKFDLKLNEPNNG